MLRWVMGVTIMLAATGSAAAGPFGIDMGTPIGAFSVKETGTRGRAVIDPPNAHDDFKRYVVIHHPSTGVCAIEAETDEIPTKSDGEDLRLKFSELRTTLEGVYGKSKIVDSIKSGASYSSDFSWMRALWLRERIFYASWNKNDKVSLRNDISSVVLELTGHRDVWESGKYGHVKIRYEFNNFQECQKGLKAERMRKL